MALAQLIQLVYLDGGNRREANAALLAFGATLAKLGEDKESSGFLGKIGLGSRSCYAPEFRLVCRAWAAFLQLQAR